MNGLWIPLLIALAALCAGISQLGGPRGAGRPYPARSWALAAVALAVAAVVLIVIAAVEA